jgi:putative ABC transport system substrate-binding protein
MRRRDFIAGLGGAAAWPLMARAQQPAMPVIGFLHSASPGPFMNTLAAFRRGLSEAGYSEGQNVSIDYRWAGGQFDRLSGMAADLVRRQVALIFAGSSPAALAAKTETTTIPIVFAVGDDPVHAGLVQSLSRPEGNLTGTTFFTVALGAKRLELLHELVPNATTIAMVLNSKAPTAEAQIADAKNGARATGQQIQIYTASTASEIEMAFNNMMQRKPDALLVGTDPFFNNQRDQLVSLAARHRIPAVYALRAYALAGGMMSYGASITDAAHGAGIYVGRILKGVRPSDLPIVQPTRFELVLNLKAAKSIDFTIPESFLLRADEVIE